MTAWHLFIAEPRQDWQPAGSFADLAAAAAAIRQLEGYPVNGVFLEFSVDPFTTDVEALSHFEHSGARNRYVIRRIAQ